VLFLTERSLTRILKFAFRPQLEINLLTIFKDNKAYKQNYFTNIMQKGLNIPKGLSI
jgi:hypothetical protein